MPLTSASTLDEIKAAYIDNAAYAELDSTSMARSFVTACRVLLLKLPKQTSKDNANAQFNPDLIRQELVAAQQFINSRGGDAVGASTGGVKFADFSDGRE